MNQLCISRAVWFSKCKIHNTNSRTVLELMSKVQNVTDEKVYLYIGFVLTWT
jgi:hypothetical protein